ncbi:unnamed protein product [Camellia sinensis]
MSLRPAEPAHREMGLDWFPLSPPTYHHAEWPNIPTELTGWRYGTSYPIPIEPPMPDHRYVSDPDSPSMPPLYTEPQVGSSRPSRGVGRGGSTRGRGRRRAPVVEEESSEEEEPAHPQSETSADREGGSGSDSGSRDETEEGSEDDIPNSDDDDGAEAVPQKRTKGAFYSCS